MVYYKGFDKSFHMDIIERQDVRLRPKRRGGLFLDFGYIDTHMFVYM